MPNPQSAAPHFMSPRCRTRHCQTALATHPRTPRSIINPRFQPLISSSSMRPPSFWELIICLRPSPHTLGLFPGFINTWTVHFNRLDGGPSYRVVSLSKIMDSSSEGHATAHRFSDTRNLEPGIPIVCPPYKDLTYSFRCHPTP